MPLGIPKGLAAQRGQVVAGLQAPKMPKIEHMGGTPKRGEDEGFTEVRRCGDGACDGGAGLSRAQQKTRTGRCGFLRVWPSVSSQCAGPHPAHAIVPNRIVAIVRIGHVGVEDGVHGNNTNPSGQGLQRFHW